ncbi:uncharacterized protein LOC133386672 isoform X2 [Rhineura floridana]|uniref:uncharacterized protein LOC133386672 isoform X2 n=1 Tax=Rhineura floridana TaxID=261503 RepID=UPI002AC82E36|nr:uncharacterized protein LOC133386672 isoform X2 [Rhineura floridana]
MPPRKAQQKKGVRVVKQTTKHPPPQQNLSSDEEEDLGTIRALVARVEALEKEHMRPLDADAGTSSAPAGLKNISIPVRIVLCGHSVVFWAHLVCSWNTVAAFCHSYGSVGTPEGHVMGCVVACCVPDHVID